MPRRKSALTWSAHAAGRARRSICTTGRPSRCSRSMIVGIGALGRAEQQPVDALLAHPLDEAVLARRRFGRIGEKGDPAGAIERVIDAGGQLGVERIGDLADDQADGVGQARRADWRRRGHRHSRARRSRSWTPLARRLGDQRAVAQHERHRRRRDAGMPGDVLHRGTLLHGGSGAPSFADRAALLRRGLSI